MWSNLHTLDEYTSTINQMHRSNFPWKSEAEANIWRALQCQRPSSAIPDSSSAPTARHLCQPHSLLNKCFEHRNVKVRSYKKIFDPTRKSLPGQILQRTGDAGIAPTTRPHLRLSTERPLSSSLAWRWNSKTIYTKGFRFQTYRCFFWSTCAKDVWRQLWNRSQEQTMSLSA